MPRQLIRFAAIGIVSTLVYLVLFVLLRGVAGAQLANFLALALTAVGNTAANRRLTFGIRGREDAVRHQFQGFGIFLSGVVITSGSLALLHLSNPEANSMMELSLLVAANPGGHRSQVSAAPRLGLPRPGGRVMTPTNSSTADRPEMTQHRQPHQKDM